MAGRPTVNAEYIRLGLTKQQMAQLRVVARDSGKARTQIIRECIDGHISPLAAHYNQAAEARKQAILQHFADTEDIGLAPNPEQVREAKSLGMKVPNIQADPDGPWPIRGVETRVQGPDGVYRPDPKVRAKRIRELKKARERAGKASATAVKREFSRCKRAGERPYPEWRARARELGIEYEE